MPCRAAAAEGGQAPLVTNRTHQGLPIAVVLPSGGWLGLPVPWGSPFYSPAWLESPLLSLTPLVGPTWTPHSQSLLDLLWDAAKTVQGSLQKVPAEVGGGIRMYRNYPA